MNKSRKFTALIVINILSLCFCYVAAAQISDDTEGLYIEKPKTITIGLVAGGNFCQVDGDSYAGYHKVGLNVGGIGYIQVHRRTAISFEMLYTQKGARSNNVRYSPIDSATLITKYGINLNYVEIPVMLNYFDKRKSHFGMGMSYSRLINSTETMSTLPEYNIDFTKFPFRTNTYDFVACAQMHVWKGLFFNIRFQYALTPARTNSPTSLSRAQKQFNNLWTVRLMYLFI